MNLDETVDAFAELRLHYEDHVQYHRERRQEPMDMTEWCKEEVRIEGPLASDAAAFLVTESTGSASFAVDYGIPRG